MIFKSDNSKSSIIKKTLLIIIILIILLGIIMIITRINTIKVSGNKHYTKEEIFEIMGIDENSNVFDVLIFNISDKHKNYPYIENIDIEYSSINSIHIIVEEKHIIGYIQYMGKYLCLDEDGYIIDYTNKVDENIPIINGIKINSFTLNEKAEIDSKTINAINIIEAILKEYNIIIDVIDFKYDADNKIVLYYNDIEIYIGNTDQIYEKIQMLSEILDTIPLDSKGTLDIRDLSRKILFKKK